jgi:hypothetical protein
MAVTVEQLLIEYREFEPLHAENETLVAAVLARADRRISPSWPSDTRDDVVYLQAADMLARTPMGRNANLSSPDYRVRTTYAEELDQRRKGYAFARARMVT